MADKVKKCIYCGNKPIIVKAPKFTKGYHWYIHCDRGDVIVCTKNCNTRKEAIEAWNCRVGEAENE